ncbi:hypothetical protein CAMGR0001_2234 [Campylobacter gracilis RM3268]|uniref:Uncharacterized protein n=1 Tax=Campylobacter gracilis RM3268 TaxID=553220 RepID=C8PH46_9BACT|nr:hypothetical protein CAMGR0001_2234 [Campylobacter gracilis RM3268]
MLFVYKIHMQAPLKFNIKLIAPPFYVLVIFLFDLYRRKAHV